MNVTKELLKKESANFDVECIFQLNLQNKEITNLGSLSECTNLEILNVSSNDISNLVPLKTLVNLQYLNLSCNRISNLDGLQSLDKLRSLNLAGNLINRTLEVLNCLQNLTNLKLMDVKNGYTNPVCHCVNYNKDVRTILPNLIQLDDDCGKISNNLEIVENNSSRLDQIDKQLMNLASLETKWTTTEYFKVNPIEENIVENTVTGDLSKFSNSCINAKENLNDTQKYINNIISQFHV